MKVVGESKELVWQGSKAKYQLVQMSPHELEILENLGRVLNPFIDSQVEVEMPGIDDPRQGSIDVFSFIGRLTDVIRHSSYGRGELSADSEAIAITHTVSIRIQNLKKQGETQ